VPATPTLTDRDRLAASFEGLFATLRRLNPSQEISLTAASTLRTLERDGPHRISDLAVREGVSQPAMTQLVARLERAGQVERTTDPADGRAVLVRVTTAGRALLRRRREQRADRLYELVEALPAADRAAILAALPALDRLAGLPPTTDLAQTTEGTAC
jgi:DNA-binding MarR family transcriptional regulator